MNYDAFVPEKETAKPCLVLFAIVIFSTLSGSLRCSFPAYLAAGSEGAPPGGAAVGAFPGSPGGDGREVADVGEREGRRGGGGLAGDETRTPDLPPGSPRRLRRLLQEQGKGDNSAAFVRSLSQ